MTTPKKGGGVSKFEEHFVSYDTLKEWEWESPSQVSGLLQDPVFVSRLGVS